MLKTKELLTKITTTLANGGQGIGDKHYIYFQDTPSAEWTVTHNLGKVPAVTVVDSAGTEVEGSYQHTDGNTSILTFEAAFSGKAYFN